MMQEMSLHLGLAVILRPILNSYSFIRCKNVAAYTYNQLGCFSHFDLNFIKLIFL